MNGALVIAHMGHVLIDAPLFMGPVVLMAGALWFSTWRGKRSGGGDGGSD
jgi:hypothetical protein